MVIGTVVNEELIDLALKDGKEITLQQRENNMNKSKFGCGKEMMSSFAWLGDMIF